MEKGRNKIIILLLLLSVLIILFTFYINSRIILEKKEIYAELIVGENVGFDLNKTALTFGKVNAGSTSTRKILVENAYNFPVRFEFEPKGEIKDLLLYEESITLNPGESKIISISTIDPTGLDFGRYSGKFIITTKKIL